MSNSKKLTQIEFINRSAEKHNNKYDYSKTKYINQRTKVTIICPSHGDFYQTPNSHIQGSGCYKCGKDRIKRTTEQFIKEAQDKHSSKYDYSLVEYVGKEEKVKIICKVHSVFEQGANAHIRGNNCPKCSFITTASKTTKTTEEFIKEASIVHNYKYSYPTTQYKGALGKLEVLCKPHGVFSQSASNHLHGAGCPLCIKEQVSSWSRSDYIKKANGRICTFYTIRCFNDEEEFYKIGITMRGVKNRYCGSTSMPYEYEVISEVKGSAGFIWDLERDEKRKLKSLHYKPKIDFKGSKTECFTNYNLENG